MEKYIKNHQQHKYNQNYFGSDSEIYISYFISKIISLSITQSEFSNQIITHIPNECADYTINRIKNFISLQTIPYTKDDNSFAEIIQPKPATLDRNSELNNTLISYDIFIPPEPKVSKKGIIMKKATIKRKESIIAKKSNKVKEKKKEPIEFSSYDIEGFDKAEEIRKEKERLAIQKKIEEERKKKEEETLKQLQKEKEIKENISKIFQKKYPSYLKNKDITLDIKGDIVSIKRIDIKKLSPQFSFGGCKTKECALIKNTLLTKTIEKPYIESPKIKPITKEKNKAIIPAGSSFDLIKLEKGVSIKEDNKYKTGGRYKIASQAIKDILSLSSSNIKTKQDKTIEPSHKKETRLEQIKPKSKNNILTINVKNAILKTVIDKLDLINENEHHLNKSKSNINFFKHHKIPRLSSPYSSKANSLISTNQNLSEMNKFTIQIMTNSKWGSQKDIYNLSNKVITIKKPRKHSELNSPRTRQFQLKKMNRTSSLGFFSISSK